MQQDNAGHGHEGIQYESRIIPFVRALPALDQTAYGVAQTRVHGASAWHARQAQHPGATPDSFLCNVSLRAHRAPKALIYDVRALRLGIVTTAHESPAGDPVRVTIRLIAARSDVDDAARAVAGEFVEALIA